MIISKSFLRGFARALDIGAGMRNFPDMSYNPWEKDCKALKGDWDFVGEDIKKAADNEAKRIAV